MKGIYFGIWLHVFVIQFFLVRKILLLWKVLCNVNIVRKTMYRMFSRLRGNDINIAPQSLSNENFLNILSINYVFCFAICQFLMNKYFFDYWICWLRVLWHNQLRSHQTALGVSGNCLLPPHNRELVDQGVRK
jgi:hypothetical protein